MSRSEYDANLALQIQPHNRARAVPVARRPLRRPRPLLRYFYRLIGISL